jgi:solute carrier family 25 protein 34/35
MRGAASIDPLDVGLSALAPMVAALFTHPADLAKTRLQLSGELVRTSAPSANVSAVLRRVARREGARGVQRGLSAALLREGSKNGVRIGLYRPVAEAVCSAVEPGRVETDFLPLYARFVAGLICGPLGALLANPLEICKTRMMANREASPLGFRETISTVVREGSTFRGVQISMVRSALSASVGLTSMFWLKDVAQTKGVRDGIGLDLACSSASALSTVLAINGVDVVRTRLYSQPIDAVTGCGTLYSGGADAIYKIARMEGFAAFGKGLTAHALRVCPHIVLTMTFLGGLRRFVAD